MAHQAGAYPGFCSMKRLGVFLLPPGWDASPSQGYPQHLIRRYPFIHLGGERHRESRVSCPRTQHNVPGVELSKYSKSRTECSALLHNHNVYLCFNFASAAFVNFTINREPHRNSRQRCLKMLTFSLIRSCRVTKRKAKR